MSIGNQPPLHRFTEKAIQTLKRDKAYSLDKGISVWDLSTVVRYRVYELIRGFVAKPFLNHSSGPLFLGRKTSLKHKNKIHLGKSVIIGDYVIIDALSRKGVRIGNNVTISANTIIQCTGIIQHLGEGFEIGDNSAIGAYSYLGAQGGIKIGKNVIMGANVSIHSENHIYQDAEIPIRLQGTKRVGVRIDDDCWIGSKATILDGVHIHSRCVIAAASVVTKDIPANSIVAGVPARVIKQRG